MKKAFIYILFTCACFQLQAQVNFVKNPGFETYSGCPDDWDQTKLAIGWSAIDTVGIKPPCSPDYINLCDMSGKYFASAPFNSYFYQFPHSGKGMMQTYLFCDETPLPPPPSYAYRDYLNGTLHKNLTTGQQYCVTFYVNLEEASQYAINNIGAYLNNGHLDTITHCGKPITFVTPQVFTTSVISDTLKWTKIEGSFVADGTEKYITIGNFFSKGATTHTTMPDPKLGVNQYSFYLIDDVSVIPVDLPADAGPDNFVEETKTVQIGRVGDTTTEGLDCKWYHKGNLIDSGATITVHAGAKGDIDTYVVVQTICGTIKTDTTVIYTVGLGITNPREQQFSIYPNPSDGKITITAQRQGSSINATVYDLLGRVRLKQLVPASNTIQLDVPAGVYLLELSDEQGLKQRQRIQIR